METLKGAHFFGGSKAKRAAKKKAAAVPNTKNLPTTSAGVKTSPTTKSTPSKLSFDFKRVSSLASSGTKKSRSFINQLSPTSRAKQFGQLDALAAAASVSSSDPYGSEVKMYSPTENMNKKSSQRNMSGKSIGTGEMDNEDMIIKAVSSKLSVGPNRSVPSSTANPSIRNESFSEFRHQHNSQSLSRSTNNNSSSSRILPIYHSMSAEAATPKETFYHNATDSNSSWDKGTGYKPGPSIGSVFCQDVGIGLTNARRYSSNQNQYNHNEDDDEESYDVISTGNGDDRAINGSPYNNTDGLRNKIDDLSSSNVDSDESSTSMLEENLESASDGGGGGSGSNEDYSNDEDEGEDGYKLGGYHPVKIAEVYNQR